MARCPRGSSAPTIPFFLIAGRQRFRTPGSLHLCVHAETVFSATERDRSADNREIARGARMTLISTIARIEPTIRFKADKESAPNRLIEELTSFSNRLLESSTGCSKKSVTFLYYLRTRGALYFCLMVFQSVSIFVIDERGKVCSINECTILNDLRDDI